MLSTSHQKLLALTRRLVPPLLESFHKGQCGRVVVIGGCEDYTGAPFFSAHAAATLGCDLTHVICESSAAPVIKSYSPDLMVHPYMKDSSKLSDYLYRKGVNGDSASALADSDSIDLFINKEIMPKINSLLDRIHVVVVGPGFGRDQVMLATLSKILEQVKKRNLPLILDADSLYLVSTNPDIVRGYSNAIITPNVVEFKRIADALDIHETDPILEAKKVSEALGVTLLRKGEVDLIVKNGDVLRVDTKGSPKRVGGQGDSLTGLIATLLSWGTYTYKNQLWPGSKEKPILTDSEIYMLACYGGSVLTKLSAQKAFKEYGRSMQTSDLHKFIGKSYKELFENEE